MPRVPNPEASNQKNGNRPGRSRQLAELNSPDFETVRKRFENEFQIDRDVAAEIAHALFLGNKDAIYKAFGRKLMEGNMKVLEALAARAYGMPRQSAMAQREPFRLEIVHVGSMKQPEAIEVKVKGELEGEVTEQGS